MTAALARVTFGGMTARVVAADHQARVQQELRCTD